MKAVKTKSAGRVSGLLTKLFSTKLFSYDEKATKSAMKCNEMKGEQKVESHWPKIMRNGNFEC